MSAPAEEERMATKQRSFWSSTTGFVTGVAGVLTAVAGIVGAGTQLGWFDSNGSNPSGGTTSSESTVAPAPGQSGGSSRQTATTPTFDVDPPSVNFDTLNRERTVKVTNTGGSAITVQAPTVDGSQASAFRASGCSRELAAGRSCDIEVDFSPSRSGDYKATLVVQVTGAPAEEVPLAGTAIL
jgi:hypothetical protein